MWPALFRGNVCIQSDKISNVSAFVSRIESEPKHEVANIEREFKFRLVYLHGNNAAEGENNIKYANSYPMN